MINFIKNLSTFSRARQKPQTLGHFLPTDKNLKNFSIFQKSKSPDCAKIFRVFEKIFFRKFFLPARKVRLSRTLRAGTKSMILADLRKMFQFSEKSSLLQTEPYKKFSILKIFLYPITRSTFGPFRGQKCGLPQTRYHRDLKIPARSGLTDLSQTFSVFFVHFLVRKKPPKKART